VSGYAQASSPNGEPPALLGAMVPKPFSPVALAQWVRDALDGG
jgi:hypothetical protein